MTPNRCAMSITLIDAYTRRELQRRNVARFSECGGDGHGALEVVLVVVGNVVAEPDGSVHDDVCRFHAILDGGGVNVWLEAGANLAFSLRGAIEDRERVVAAAHHGQHVAAGVIDGQQSPLRARILLERSAVHAVFSRRRLSGHR